MNSTHSKDGTKIVYDTYGSGPSLLYITGAICHRTFTPVVKDAKVFAKDFKVYLYDRRGRGASGDTKPYSIDREVEDIEAMIEAAGGPVLIYGHSSGAVLGLEAAMRLPEKVSGLVIYDAPYLSDAKEKADYSRLYDAITASLEKKAHAKALRQFLSGIGMPKALTYLLPLMPGWGTVKALAPTLLYDMTLTRDLAPTERIAGLKVPAQIMVGEKSPRVLHEVARQIAKALPAAKFIEVTRQNHAIDARKLLPHLVSFLKQG